MKAKVIAALQGLNQRRRMCISARDRTDKEIWHAAGLYNDKTLCYIQAYLKITIKKGRRSERRSTSTASSISLSILIAIRTLFMIT